MFTLTYWLRYIYQHQNPKYGPNNYSEVIRINEILHAGHGGIVYNKKTKKLEGSSGAYNPDDPNDNRKVHNIVYGLGFLRNIAADLALAVLLTTGIAYNKLGQEEFMRRWKIIANEFPNHREMKNQINTVEFNR